MGTEDRNTGGWGQEWREAMGRLRHSKRQEIHDTLIKRVREKVENADFRNYRQPLCKDCTNRGFKGYDAGKKGKSWKRHI